MSILVDPEPDAVQLLPMYSEDDHDIIMGLNSKGVSYLRRGGSGWRLGYEYSLATVPYSEISSIEIKRQSSAHRVASGVLGILVGLVLLVGPIVAFFNGWLIIGLLVICSPVVIWFSIKSFFEENGFRIRIRAKSEKSGKFTLSWDDWQKHRESLSRCLASAGNIVTVAGVDADASSGGPSDSPDPQKH